MSCAASTISYAYVGEVNSNLICCVCRCPFVGPVVTTTCSHTFCRTCIGRSLEQQPCCPVDRSPLTLDNLKPENLLLRNMVDELIVECPHKPLGCRGTCQRQLLEAHLRETCQFVQIPCSEDGCEQMVLRRDLGKHIHDCVHRLVNCATCGTSITASELESHRNQCAEQDDRCAACSAKCKRKDMLGHNACCPEIRATCEQSDNGCPWEGKRKYVPVHLQTCPYEAIKGFFAVNDAQMTALRDENTVLRQNVANAEVNVDALNRELANARRALGPWWRTTRDSPRVLTADIGEPSISAQQGRDSSEQFRWRAPNPLAPIATFSPEASPVSQTQEVESVSASPVPSLSDPAFLASYFPSSVGPSTDASNTNAPGIPPSVQLDPLSRHIFPFSARVQGVFPPPPIRFPDFTSQQPSPSTAPHPRVAPIDRSTSLEGALQSLRNSIASVSSALEAVARRTDVALTTENLRMNEEVGTLRAIVHGLRMQVHALITERNGASWGTTTTYYNHPPPAPNPPLVINSTTQTQTTKL